MDESRVDGGNSMVYDYSNFVVFFIENCSISQKCFRENVKNYKICHELKKYNFKDVNAEVIGVAFKRGNDHRSRRVGFCLAISYQ